MRESVCGSMRIWLKYIGRGIGVAQLAPARAGVVGAVDAVVAGNLGDRVEHVRIGAIDGQADAALGPGRQPGFDARPGLAGVGGLPDAAAGTAAVHAPLLPPALVGRGVERLVVQRIHHQVGRPGVVVHVQRAGPGLAAVGGLVDAALAAGSPQVAGRGDVDDVEVDRIDDDAGDLLAGAQAHVLPACGRRRPTCRRRRPTTSSGGCWPRRCRPTPGWDRSGQWRWRQSSRCLRCRTPAGRWCPALVVL